MTIEHEVKFTNTKTNRSCDPVDIVIDKYSSHPNIQLIEQNVTARNKLSFRQVSLEEVLTQFRDVDPTNHHLWVVFL